MKKNSIIIFASGRGSNFEAICEAVTLGKLNCEIKLLITNKPKVRALEVAEKYHVPSFVIPHEGLTKEEHEKRILEKCGPLTFDWIVLAGYMRVFSQSFLKRFWDENFKTYRIVNIHPALLPAFPGANAYEQALNYGAKITGATVHLLGDSVDDGPIIMQKAFEIKESDTVESLTTRGLKVEHELYVKALESLFTKNWHVRAGENKRPRVVFEEF